MSEQPEMLVRRTCAWCGKQFMGRRTDSRYCTQACRQRAFRWRKRLPALERDAIQTLDSIGAYLKFADSRQLANRALYRLIAKIQRVQGNVMKEPMK